MSVMTNEEITAEFENLFASSAPDEEEPADQPEDQTTEEEVPEEAAENTSEEQGSEETPAEDEQKGDEAPVEDKKQSKQNYAFAEQRLRIKKQDDFIKNII